jgi:exopolyphosphatase/guanosine-5'-triphosphate,3'-diphosphate pyrophosphatase
VDTDPISEASYKRLKGHVRDTLRNGVRPAMPDAPSLVGSGGTVTTAASVVEGMHGRRYESTHGVEVRRADVKRLLGILRRSGAAERLALPGLPPERVDIVVAGTLVLAEVMRLFGAPSVLVNAHGIREGIVIDTLARRA